MHRRSPARPGRTFAATLLILCALAAISLVGGSGQQAKLRRRHTVGINSGAPACLHVHQSTNQCAFVKEHCSDEDAGLLSYLQLYYCSLADAKPLAFTIIALWSALLFTTIGVAASDFFCINLSAISAVLGMSESMAGVTFLAFGNGSPDVFSTFAAVRTHSGSLAVGELIGAASFITAVVAASMALVRPFKVAKKSFVRDVGFFIIAISFSTSFLANGKLGLVECIVMVGFYLFYVAVVVVWHWYLGRRRRQREAAAAARGHFSFYDQGEIETEEQYFDDPDDGETASRPSRSRVITTDDMLDLERSNLESDYHDGDDSDEQAANRRLVGDLNAGMRVTRPPGRRKRSATTTPIRPSLVGALEFQSVLSALQKSRNFQDTRINLRRYSDGADYIDGPHKRSTSIISEPERGHGPRKRPPASASTAPVYPYSSLDADDTIALVSPSPRTETAGTDEAMLEPFPEISLTTPSPGREIVTRSRSSSRRDLLAPEDAESDAPRRAHSPGPYLTASPTRMSPHLRPQLKITPPDSFHEHSLYRRHSTHLPPSPQSERPTLPCDTSEETLDAGLYPLTSYNTVPLQPPKWWPGDILPPPDTILRTLFPTMTKFRQKRFFDKILDICTAPSFFLLTITLPVVEPSAEESNDHVVLDSPTTPSHPHHPHHPSSIHANSASEAVSIEERHHRHYHDNTPVSSGLLATVDEDLEEETTRVAHTPLEGASAAHDTRDWNRWLVLIQCFTAPSFIVAVIWTNFDDATPADLGKAILWSMLTSAISALLLYFTTTPDHPPKWQLILCFAGFAVSIAWISTIANEVVGVLKAIGVIFNISDAILGLTIFAVCNSLGDLVADITVARLGYPVMALSACFGGPMLNILLGIGLSGLYMVVRGEEKYHKKHPHKSRRYKPFEIEVSWTLLVSAIGLLVTLVSLLILVPLNKWRMDRRIAALLVVIWVISTIINIVVEVTGVADRWTPIRQH